MKRKVFVGFAIICVIFLFGLILFNYMFFPKKYKNYVYAFSDKYRLERALVFAIIKTESNFDKNAVSKSGAVGLMQIMPSTAAWIASELEHEFNADSLLDPETNIMFGCFYLRYLFDKFEYQDVVIAAYNAGEGNVLEWLDDDGMLVQDKIEFVETKNYLKKVKKYHNFYK